jgi:predicted Rossmann-fold nucleotide-binding protein
MKVTIYGGGNSKQYTPEQIEKCEKLGKFLGERKATVLTGACRGYPFYVGKACVQNGGTVYGYTPAKNKKEHIESYQFPMDGVTKLVYAKKKYRTQAEAFMRREVTVASNTEVGVFLGGSWGTFTELILSFAVQSTMILVEEFEGAVKAFDDVYKFFAARDINPVVHNGATIIKVKNVDEAIQKLIELKV